MKEMFKKFYEVIFSARFHKVMLVMFTIFAIMDLLDGAYAWLLLDLFAIVISYLNVKVAINKEREENINE